MEKFGPFYSNVEDIFFLWTDAWLLLYFVLGVVHVFGSKMAQFIISSLLYLAVFVIVMLFLPFTQVWKNFFVAISFGFAVLLSIINLSTSPNLMDELQLGGYECS